MMKSILNTLEKLEEQSTLEKLRKILFHINNALKLGIDVTEPLNSVLEELENQEELEIKKYLLRLFRFHQIANGYIVLLFCRARVPLCATGSASSACMRFRSKAARCWKRAASISFR